MHAIFGIAWDNMRTRLRLFAFAPIAIVLCSTGCGKHFSIAAPPPPPALKDTKYTPENYNADLKAYETNVAANNATLARQTRNKIVYRLMSEIDDAYGEFTKQLFTGKGAFGVWGDSTQLGLTAASTISTQNRTKTILSALATGLAGVNLSFDKNFFAQQTFQTIAVAMQTRRDKARAAIVSNLDDEVADYPLEAARRDLVSYFYAGTLAGGLQELQEEAGDAAKKTPNALH